ncbi:hypothetical protein M5K25_002187 [Dendrobium thyrsiflorum]|uniref:Uncharacterized protein n=1 Tax=Dendrobium thyrsiflorum TaxID=117978 RepID=A0ABD0VSD2_DENTH
MSYERFLSSTPDRFGSSSLSIRSCASSDIRLYIHYNLQILKLNFSSLDCCSTSPDLLAAKGVRLLSRGFGFLGSNRISVCIVGSCPAGFHTVEKVEDNCEQKMGFH